VFRELGSGIPPVEGQSYRAIGPLFYLKTFFYSVRKIIFMIRIRNVFISKKPMAMFFRSNSIISLN